MYRSAASVGTARIAPDIIVRMPSRALRVLRIVLSVRFSRPVMWLKGLCRGQRRRALSLHGSKVISLPLGPMRNEFGPAIVRVWTAKSTVAGDHLLHAHFVGWQSAIVMKEIARISARAPRHLSGLAD